MPCVLKRFNLSGVSIADLSITIENNGVVPVRVERWVQVNKVNAVVRNVGFQDIKVVAVVDLFGLCVPRAMVLPYCVPQTFHDRQQSHDTGRHESPC